MSYAGKNACAGKTSGVLRGGALGANRGYVLAHCAPPLPPTQRVKHGLELGRIVSFLTFIQNFSFLLCLIKSCLKVPNGSGGGWWL